MKEIWKIKIEKIEAFKDDCLLRSCRTFQKFDFVAIPSYLAVISFNYSEPNYFIKTVKKTSTQELKDRHERVGFLMKIISGSFICKNINQKMLIKTSLLYRVMRFS